MPQGVKVSLDCFGLIDSTNKSVLHVQSISRWAPTCIGPYSQATKLHCSPVVHLAGQVLLTVPSCSLTTIRLLWALCQIGQYPATMTLQSTLAAQVPAHYSLTSLLVFTQAEQCVSNIAAVLNVLLAHNQTPSLLTSTIFVDSSSDPHTAHQ